MIRSFIMLLACSLMLFSCKNKTETSDGTATTPPVETTLPSNTVDTKSDMTEVEAAKKGIKALIAGNMVEDVTLNDGKLSIKYFSTAADFHATSPTTIMDDNAFISYWKTASRAEKAITLVPAQMLNSFSFVKSVDVSLNTGENILTATVTRDDIMAYTGKTWEELQKDWNDVFRKNVVNSAQNRKAYFDKIVKVN